ncbi:MAG: 4Fe-4S dicluster domain-containing protein [Coriobacteriia bacterium]|nr:4Fe-4S dicluster domain-containing protein [Coriobacteriia bacterium]
MTNPGRIIPYTLKMMVSKPATVTYPAGDVHQFPAIRGRIVYDAALCIGCTACMRDCPTDAIVIEKIVEKLPEKFFAATIMNDRCIYCAQCVDGCPKDALQFTPEFELAGLSRDSMHIRTAL